MKLLLFSDVHRNLDAARRLVILSRDVDVALCAGDLAVTRRGLEEVVNVLSAIEVPTVLVPGNAESDGELAQACAEWPAAHVLHGAGTEIGETSFWGVGGAIPVTPFGDWSFDLSEEEGRAMLEGCPPGGVLVSHSPPQGHVDLAGDRHLGSRAVLEAIDRQAPALVACGHIHSCWEQEAAVGATRVINAGPRGVVVEI